MDFDTSKSQNKLRDLLMGMKYCMLTTKNSEGMLLSRPMTLLDHDNNDDLWFFTAKSCTKTQAILSSPDINISFANTKTGKYISLSGTAYLVENINKKKRTMEC